MTSRKAQRRVSSKPRTEMFLWAARAKGAMGMVADMLTEIGQAALAEGATESQIAELCGKQRLQLRTIKGALGPAPKPEVDMEAELLFKELDKAFAAAEAGDVTAGAAGIKEGARQLKILERMVLRILRSENR
jgi:hypothetical protein